MPNRLRLTDISVRALKPAAAQTTFWDDTLPAFGIRVGRRSKAFIVIRDGVKSTGMKPHARKMTAHQMWDVVNYVRSIAAH